MLQLEKEREWNTLIEPTYMCLRCGHELKKLTSNPQTIRLIGTSSDNFIIGNVQVYKCGFCGSLDFIQEVDYK
jgi:hypothetical protein